MDNCKPISDPDSESCHREFAHGKYYDGNTAKNPKTVMELEGSQGLMVDQGATRWSLVPSVEDEDNNTEEISSFESTIPKGSPEGSHLVFGKLATKKVAREI